MHLSPIHRDCLLLKDGQGKRVFATMLSAPCEQRVRAPRGRNDLIHSQLHLLKSGSLLKTRGNSDYFLSTGLAVNKLAE
jgi:hypothetical protein